MNQSATALIIAGGPGTRLARSHPDLPKPLVPVLGNPVLGILMNQLVKAGTEEIHFSLRHQAEVIRDYVLTTPPLPRERLHFHVEEEPLGTAGALFELKDRPGPVLMVNGDLLSAIDLAELLALHREEGNDLTLATHDEHHRLELGEVISDEEGRVRKYVEKPTKSWRISSGTNVIGPKALALVTERGWLAFPDLVNRAIEEGLQVGDHHHSAPWIDINSESELATAGSMLAADPVAFGLDPDQVRP